MNIYALKGHKVKCVTLEGWREDLAQKHLEIGKEYTVVTTYVDSCRTGVCLQEFPNEIFNSVFFEDVTEQDEETDKRHLDYWKYN